MALRRRILPHRTADRTAFVHFAINFVKILQKTQKTLVLYISVRYIIYYEKISENAGILSNSAAPFHPLGKTKENQWEELMESKNRSTAAAAPELLGRRLSARPWKRKTPAPNQRRGLAGTPFWRHGRYTAEDLGIHTEEAVRHWPAAADPAAFSPGPAGAAPCGAAVKGRCSQETRHVDTACRSCRNGA